MFDLTAAKAVTMQRDLQQCPRQDNSRVLVAAAAEGEWSLGSAAGASRETQCNPIEETATGMELSINSLQGTFAA